MKLRLIKIVSEDRGRECFTDQRRVLNSVIASYVGEDGHEYRKKFVSYGEPNVPETGTHKELNAVQNQF